MKKKSTYVIILAISLGILLRIFYQIVIVSGTSMVPTFQSGNWVVEQRIHSALKIGEVVIVYEPEVGKLNPYIIKRVVGLPGDTLQIKNGYLYRDGEKIVEPYINQRMNNTPPMPGSQWALIQHAYTVPKGEVFVMGDNRNISVDSRYFGPFPNKDIKGIVVLRLFPHFRVF